MDAGTREYANGRYWHGYYSGKIVCGLTGGVIPSVDPANRQECHLFLELFDRACAMVGEAPETVTGDRGLSVAACFKHATERGTAPIFPYRRSGTGKRKDQLTHDRHGVVRCKYCGGPTRQIKFSKNNGKPRLWVVCEDGKQTPECAKQQTIYCETDWRSLIPIPRTDPAYHELKATHQQFEAMHDYWRDRYRVAANSVANRPKMIGLGARRLRAAVACFIDWLRIAVMNGWTGSARPTKRGKLVKGVRRSQKTGEENALSLAEKRARLGLLEHYGPQAAKLGIGDALPPSERGSP